jgi:large subunit ribosomal protein L28
MSRRCEITSKGVMSGNKISHAHNKTRRRFLPNIQKVSLISETLGKKINLKLCVSTIRTIEHNGGLDSYLLKTSNKDLSKSALDLKKIILKNVAAVN